MPLVCGKVPVKSAARAGPHTGWQVYARSKRTPWLASRSRLGVRMSGLP